MLKIFLIIKQLIDRELLKPVNILIIFKSAVFLVNSNSYLYSTKKITINCHR